jgi:hypothetical protein
VRLQALGVDLASVAPDALAVLPTPSAGDLVPGLEAREEKLTVIYQFLLANSVGVGPGAPAGAQH